MCQLRKPVPTDEVRRLLVEARNDNQNLLGVARLGAGNAGYREGGREGESWRFDRNQTVTSVNVVAKLWINSAPGVLAAAVAGLGIALATRVMAGEELRSGQLVHLLKPYRLAPAEVHAVFPAGPRPSAKVRAIVDHLTASLGASD